MNPLKPFDENQGKGIQIFADIVISDVWTISFLIDDPKKSILYHLQNGRQDGLWQQTCFEFFLQKEGDLGYWEFNFSPASAWNIYRFESYRHPQPPKKSDDFLVQNIQFDGEKLVIELKPQLSFEKGQFFKIGFSAVIESKDKTKSFWALTHSQEKPDFHWSESFSQKCEVL